MKFLRGRSGRVAAWITSTAIAVGVALLVPALAAANTATTISPSDPHNPQTLSGWQAGTCKKEPAATAEPAAFCNVKSNPGEFFFEQAAGHPNFGFTQFIVAHTETVPGTFETPTGELKDVRVDLPIGLSTNPGATKLCTQAQFDSDSCPPETKVGESQVTVSVPPLGAVVKPIENVTAVPVYNVVPPQGKVARFGLKLAGNPVYIEGDVAYAAGVGNPLSAGDYHEGFSIPSSKTGSSSTAAPVTAPSSPTPAPAPAKRSFSRAAFTRPTCSPARSKKRTSRATSSRRARHRRWSRRSRLAPRRKNAARSPTRRRSKSRRGPPPPTRPPAPKSTSPSPI